VTHSMMSLEFASPGRILSRVITEGGFVVNDVDNKTNSRTPYM
jgi:hypothetical protein